jgi:hypothetical protein
MTLEEHSVWEYVLLLVCAPGAFGYIGLRIRPETEHWVPNIKNQQADTLCSYRQLEEQYGTVLKVFEIHLMANDGLVRSQPSRRERLY